MGVFHLVLLVDAFSEPSPSPVGVPPFCCCSLMLVLNQLSRGSTQCWVLLADACSEPIPDWNFLFAMLLCDACSEITAPWEYPVLGAAL